MMTYVRKLGNWDKKAAVRVKPRRILLQEEESAGKVFFSPELVPVAQHPLVLNIGPEAVRDLQIQHLYRYLDFTTQLELEVINEVSKEIALDKVDVEVPHVMREDAFKLCTDEAHHAYFSDDIKRQVIAATGLSPENHGNPRFLRQLRALQRDLPPELILLSELLFSVVSETLISTILAQIPKDDRVVTAIRQIVADHAEDEGRHSAYFSQFFSCLWPQMSCAQRAILGPLLPRFIRAFLEPDLDAIARGLARHPLDDDQIRSVLEQCYPSARVGAEARQAATVTLRLFENQEVLDDPWIADAFRDCGLVD
jgi:hypothetical protein